MASRTKIAMVFGVFDLLHPGHLYLLYHARLRGTKLIAVIARDTIVKKLKGRMPTWNERERVRVVKMTGLATSVILGDAKEGSYAVIKKYKPDLICLGYDQARLKKDLRNRLPKISLYTLKPYKAEVFHTSIRRKRK